MNNMQPVSLLRFCLSGTISIENLCQSKLSLRGTISSVTPMKIFQGKHFTGVVVIFAVLEPWC